MKCKKLSSKNCQIILTQHLKWLNKTIIIWVTNSILFLVFLISCNNMNPHQDVPELIPFKKDKLWGYCDKDKNVIIEPSFMSANFFYEDLAAVTIEHGNDWLFGYINKKGDFVIEPKYEWARRFWYGYAIVDTENTKQLITKDGEVKLEAEWIEFKEKDSVYVVYQNLKSNLGAYFYDINLNMLNKRGIIDFPYLWFNEGLMPVKFNGAKYYSYVNEKFEEVLTGKFVAAYSFYDGQAVIYDGSTFCIINKNGEFIKELPYDQVLGYSEGLYLVGNIINSKLMCGYVDKNGVEVIPLKFNGASYFSEGLAWVFIDNKRGYIDTSGELVIPAIYDANGRRGYAHFKNGTVIVSKEGVFGMIDKTGKDVIPFEYQRLKLQKNGLILAQNDNKYGFINKRGKTVIDFKYSYADDFKNGLSEVSRSHNSIFVKFYIDSNGNEYLIEN
jgi:hypothetical protein